MFSFLSGKSPSGFCPRPIVIFIVFGTAGSDLQMFLTVTAVIQEKLFGTGFELISHFIEFIKN